MLFTYPKEPHLRKHGPRGYDDFSSYKPWLRDEFVFQCVYCLTREKWNRAGHFFFGVDHVIPKSNQEGKDLVLDYENLVYACNACNSMKGGVSVRDPCSIGYGRHIRVKTNGEIEGMTDQGAEIIEILGLDNPVLTEYRRRWSAIIRALTDTPEHDPLRREWLGFPDDLPDLRALRPRDGNSRCEGLDDCHAAMKERGELPEIY